MQECATLLGARYVPERLCGGIGYPVYKGAIAKVILYVFICV